MMRAPYLRLESEDLNRRFGSVPSIAFPSEPI